ncbi:MAG: hypothetical protein C4321_01980 [Chloroflexota bacterium]
MQHASEARTSGLARLRAQFGQHRLPLIAYVPFGDPLVPGHQYLDVYADAGVSILEVGMPTADPYLDGPEIAKETAAS